jgi:acyl-coenzyme A thioesterase PaaI-like protein
MSGTAIPADWTPIEPFPQLATNGVFISRDPGTRRLRLRFFRRAADDTLCAMAWFGPGTEGPPGHAHGGSIASALDEAMGAAAWYAGYPVVAARLTIEFRDMVPLETEAIVEMQIESIEGRKIRTRGQLVGADGTLFAEGEGLFIVLGRDQLERLGERVD